MLWVCKACGEENVCTCPTPDAKGMDNYLKPTACPLEFVDEDVPKWEKAQTEDKAGKDVVSSS